MRLIIEGPDEARVGDTISYHPFYSVIDSTIELAFIIPDSLTYQSSRLLGGSGELLTVPADGGPLVWRLDKIRGRMEVTLHVRDGAHTAGVSAYLLNQPEMRIDSNQTTILALDTFPCFTGDCSRIAMWMYGPSNANRGEVLTYQLAYEVRGASGTGARISFPNYVEYVSSRTIAGDNFSPEPGFPALGMEPGRGEVEIALRVSHDAPLESFPVGAYEPGTGTTQSNAVFTTITSD